MASGCKDEEEKEGAGNLDAMVERILDAMGRERLPVGYDTSILSELLDRSSVKHSLVRQTIPEVTNRALWKRRKTRIEQIRNAAHKLHEQLIGDDADWVAWEIGTLRRQVNGRDVSMQAFPLSEGCDDPTADEENPSQDVPSLRATINGISRIHLTAAASIDRRDWRPLMPLQDQSYVEHIITGAVRKAYNALMKSAPDARPPVSRSAAGGPPTGSFIQFACAVLDALEIKKSDGGSYSPETIAAALKGPAKRARRRKD